MDQRTDDTCLKPPPPSVLIIVLPLSHLPLLCWNLYQDCLPSPAKESISPKTGTRFIYLDPSHGLAQGAGK